MVCDLVHAVSAINESKNTNVLFIERYAAEPLFLRVLKVSCGGAACFKSFKSFMRLEALVSEVSKVSCA